MNYIEVLKTRRNLKLELIEAKKNRRPEETITVTRRQMVLSDGEYGPCYKIVEREVETTAKEMELESEIARLKMMLNGSAL